MFVTIFAIVSVGFSVATAIGQNVHTNVMFMIFLISDEVFVVQPSTQTVAENSGDAIFNCTAYSLGQHWYVSEGLSDSKKNLDRGIHEMSVTIDAVTNLKIHLLYVPSRISNDGLEITCYIYTRYTVPSEVATMRVQGQFCAICRRVTFVRFARLLVCVLFQDDPVS